MRKGGTASHPVVTEFEETIVRNMIAGLLGAALIACPGAYAQEQAPQGAAADEAPAVPAKPEPKKVVLKRTGRVIYKCGDQFTDQPVCPDHSKPRAIRRSAEDEQRCEQFNRTNYIPWYCRK
jgi:hypothetical protein